ncbi:mitochondrial cardiolipin hydrolase [Hylaeus anthracinus]|uniref:mitochondrial cardiolipin hydrolase n=1 Tax=Hylaeus anthracinus TaxID=313031 RepID=UPI0023B920E8|nr:mitochondrial cardiolipin hydrolase [Hylaeus anthracinus]
MINKKIFIAGGILIASEIVWQLYKIFPNFRKTCVHESKRKILEVMFFSIESSLCRAHAANDKMCHKENCPVRYIRKLVNYIDCAEKSLDVCIHMLTCQSLANAIVNARKRGIAVRVILDRSKAVNDASQTAVFHSNGVVIRMPDLDVLMHHKFLIVDSEILISGSTNWTMSAFFGNFENIVVTNHSSTVKPFVEEFERLWTLFEHPIPSELEESLKRPVYNSPNNIL